LQYAEAVCDEVRGHPHILNLCLTLFKRVLAVNRYWHRHDQRKLGEEQVRYFLMTCLKHIAYEEADGDNGRNRHTSLKRYELERILPIYNPIKEASSEHLAEDDGVTPIRL